MKKKYPKQKKKIKQKTVKIDYNKIFKKIKNNIDKIDYKKKINRSNSMDKLIKKFSILEISNKLLQQNDLNNEIENKEIKNEENNMNFEDIIESNLKEKNTKTKKRKINYKPKGEDITYKIIIKEDSIKELCPFEIYYDNVLFTIEGANPKDRQRITWHCINYRKKKNKPENCKTFCNAVIQGLRNLDDPLNIKYYLKENHSELCNNYFNNLKKNNNFDIQNLKESNNNINIKTINNDEITKDDITDKKDFHKYLEKYMKNNKELNLECKDFIKYAKNFYNNNKYFKYFKIDDIFLRNTFYKIKKKLFKTDIENLYEYSKELNNGENFCRYITVKQLISRDYKKIEHKAIIFFSDFDIKRLIASEHLLIDGTFIYPEGFMQTVIIMFYDVIIEKMIPGIFIILNNKTEEGYIDCFIYLKYHIDKLICIEKKEKLRFTRFTNDFEIALINAFNKVFNREKKIHRICY